MAKTPIEKEKKKLTKNARYTHYLRPEDETLAKGLWNTIQLNNDPANALFHFTVRCGVKGDADCPDGS